MDSPKSNSAMTGECKYCFSGHYQPDAKEHEHVFSRMHIQQVLQYILKNNINDMADDEEEDGLDDDLMHEQHNNEDAGIDMRSDDGQTDPYKSGGSAATAKRDSDAAQMNLSDKFSNDNDNLDLSNNRINNIEHIMHQQYNYNQMRGEFSAL